MSMTRMRKFFYWLIFQTLFALALPAVGAEDTNWPDLASPPKEIGGGEKDAAVVVGAENYAFVAKVPGAKNNAQDWYLYFTKGLSVPPDRVALLRDNEATLEKMRKHAKLAASQVKPGGTLWFVFIGHGAPAKDGKDGLLVGADAQQDADSLYARSLPQSELLSMLGKGSQEKTVALIDTCFSGRTPEGEQLVGGLQPLIAVNAGAPLALRTVVLTAAKSDQFAGPLPGAHRPAFSYLALGALRGWTGDGKGNVTAAEISQYTNSAMGALIKDRTQTPEVLGDGSLTFPAGKESGPDLAAMTLRITPSKASETSFNLSVLPEVPKANMPSSVGAVPRAQLPGDIGQARGIDFGSVNVDELGRYDEAVRFEKGDASPKDKAWKWRALGADVKAYSDIAAKRAAEWADYAAHEALKEVITNDKGASAPEDKAAKWEELAEKYPQFKPTSDRRAEEWNRYARELAEAKAARKKREELRDKDWEKLSKLLSFSVVSVADKRKFSLSFVSAYGKTLDDNPYIKDLVKYLPLGMVKVTPGARHNAVKVPKEEAPHYSESSGFSTRPQRVTLGKPEIQWVRIPGGTFTMGSADPELVHSYPPHEVTVKSFEMAKTLVTNKQYKACVEAGVCKACQDIRDCPAEFAGDDQPVVGVDWNQAVIFSQWVDGRLPSEAEWEYAARSAGKNQKYPWGDEDATCERAVILGCGNVTAPVCSRPIGNTEHGLCDMAGNVNEWVQDLWYDGTYNRTSTDGSAWEDEYPVRERNRVVRGGFWQSDAGGVRSARRYYHGQNGSGPYWGFRPARPIQ